MKKHQNQHGLTLIELLVSITIGIFIVGAALFVLQGVGSTGRQVNEITQLRQQGATAFRLMSKQIREAGDIQPTYDAGNNNYKFVETYEWSGLTASVGAWNPPSGVNQYLNLVQQIPSAATAEYLKDCLGNTINAANRRSTFYVKDGNLMCETGSQNKGGQPIISGVNEMVIRYRVKDGASKRKFFAANESFKWSDVDAVEICLDLLGTRNTPTVEKNYENCSGQSVTKNNRLHFVQKSLFRVNPAGLP